VAYVLGYGLDRFLFPLGLGFTLGRRVLWGHEWGVIFDSLVAASDKYANFDTGNPG
jgi:hypothetical protein